MSRQNHRDRIYGLLIRRIQSGEVGWDDRLVDVTLASELGVSRMPVRDALMRLAAEGFVSPSTRGFTLPRMSRAEILEVFELRRLLEPRAAAMAAHAMTEAGLGQMRVAVETATAALDAGSIASVFNASGDFRAGWLGCVPNRALAQSIQRYFVQVQNVRITTMRNRDTFETVLGGQRELLVAFQARDSVRAADRMLRFVIEGEQSFLHSEQIEVPAAIIGQN